MAAAAAIKKSCLKKELSHTNEIIIYFFRFQADRAVIAWWIGCAHLLFVHTRPPLRPLITNIHWPKLEMVAAVARLKEQLGTIARHKAVIPHPAAHARERPAQGALPGEAR